MPISDTTNCSENHWREVQSIIREAVTDAGFEATLVSESTDVGVIQKRIVQNLYENPVVVCDVSEKNANVMFELGMRLAFDKPVIIIKDDKTSYSFDTAPVEHLTYPRDLRFSSIVDFKKKLSAKVQSVEASSQDHSFLSSFGSFKVAEINVETAPADSLILEELQSLKGSIRRLEIQSRLQKRNLAAEHKILAGSDRHFESWNPGDEADNSIDVCLEGRKSIPDQLEVYLQEAEVVMGYKVRRFGDDHFHLLIELEPTARRSQRAMISSTVDKFVH
ncbi:hypothetical protein [Phaeobacter inhibens]|nr:hypothetical protein [Phaeobacter inhibens]UWR95247.1 hypothetical protein K4K99_12805 [Phaeobacter inhibens]